MGGKKTFHFATVRHWPMSQISRLSFEERIRYVSFRTTKKFPVEFLGGIAFFSGKYVILIFVLDGQHNLRWPTNSYSDMRAELDANKAVRDAYVTATGGIISNVGWANVSY